MKNIFKLSLVGLCCQFIVSCSGDTSFNDLKDRLLPNTPAPEVSDDIPTPPVVDEEGNEVLLPPAVEDNIPEPEVPVADENGILGNEYTFSSLGFICDRLLSGTSQTELKNIYENKTFDVQENIYAWASYHTIVISEDGNKVINIARDGTSNTFLYYNYQIGDPVKVKGTILDLIEDPSGKCNVIVNYASYE